MKLYDVLNSLNGVKWKIAPIYSDIEFLNCNNIKKLPKNPKSVIMFSFPYYSSKLVGNYSKYAMVDDYHKVVLHYLNDIIKRINNSKNEFVAFVDNSPINEVLYAARAGLGYRGKNGLLIDKDYGSYIFLGSIVTDLELYYEEAKIKDCLNCKICKEACPNNAITDKGVIKDRCLSYITQRKSPPNEEEIKLMQENKLLWGCDICQDVCPMNKNIKETKIEEFLNNIICNLDYYNINYKDRAYSYRGAKVLKRNLKILDDLY